MTPLALFTKPPMTSAGALVGTNKIPMAIQQYDFDMFADYFQFYLQDETADGNLGDSWTPAATERLLAIAPGTVGVGTVRNMTVPVHIEVRDAAPEDTLDAWDHVVECSMNVPSGRIVIAGCTDYFPDAARLLVQPGMYRVRVCYGKLASLSADGLQGGDHYTVILWHGSPIEPVILKARLTSGGG